MAMKTRTAITPRTGSDRMDLGVMRNLRDRRRQPSPRARLPSRMASLRTRRAYPDTSPMSKLRAAESARLPVPRARLQLVRGGVLRQRSRGIGGCSCDLDLYGEAP